METKEGKRIKQAVHEKDLELSGIDKVIYGLATVLPTYVAYAYDTQVFKTLDLDPEMIRDNLFANEGLFKQIRTEMNRPPLSLTMEQWFDLGMWIPTPTDTIALDENGLFINIFDSAPFRNRMFKLFRWKQEGLLTFEEVHSDSAGFMVPYESFRDQPYFIDIQFEKNPIYTKRDQQLTAQAFSALEGRKLVFLNSRSVTDATEMVSVDVLAIMFMLFLVVSVVFFEKESGLFSLFSTMREGKMTLIRAKILVVLCVAALSAILFWGSSFMIGMMLNEPYDLNAPLQSVLGYGIRLLMCYVTMLLSMALATKVKQTNLALSLTAGICILPLMLRIIRLDWVDYCSLNVFYSGTLLFDKIPGLASFLLLMVPLMILCSSLGELRRQWGD